MKSYFEFLMAGFDGRKLVKNYFKQAKSGKAKKRSLCYSYIRRDANSSLKDLVGKKKIISEDDDRRESGFSSSQKITGQKRVAFG